MTVLSEKEAKRLIEVFTDSVKWWTPMGEYYAPEDGGETYDSLVRKFFEILKRPPPKKLLGNERDRA